tara:strand:- start:16 stop:210 length:195 start_codon:yes stop_codon:yes gene_type:complete
MIDNGRRLLIRQVAEQIVEDVNDDAFAPLEVLLESVNDNKLMAFLPKEVLGESKNRPDKTTRVD